MKPPFRADQVGSLLRPPELIEARKKKSPNLKEIEDQAIRDAVKHQEAIGLEAITDGEFRRDYWHLDFMKQLDGVVMKTNAGPKFVGQEEQPPIPGVEGKVGYTKQVMVSDFSFLKKNTSKTAKFTIPSPAMLHLRGGRALVSKSVYPDIEEFWNDVSAAYKKAIKAFADAGCTYLQLDDVSFAYLCDPKIRARCVENGDDPNLLPRTYAEAINKAVAGKPAGMTITMHTCRGNFRSAWVAEGGYEPVAEAMFSSDLDGFFMEFDSARSGGFEPLRYVPKGKKVVLGLVSSKLPQLEEKNFLIGKIKEASKYVPLEDLCLSPQCGFSSTHHGNLLSQDQQWKKLEAIVKLSREVWQ